MGYHNTHIYAGCAQSDPLVQQSGIRQAITTAFCAIPRYLFELHSGFDEIYYNAYEGMELTLKISKAGKRCTYCANAVAFHAVGGSRNHMEFDNSIPGHIFWHRWKDKIHDDIQDYLSPQVTPLMRERTYFLMQGSSIPGWDKILQSLKLNYSEEFMLPSRFSKQIDLYRDLPFSALDSPQPYLFTVDSLSDIQGNQNWTMVRNHSQDIVMDTHGRICSMKKLNGLYRGNT